jgi:peptide/nickel transport system substrate-binding protein
VTVSSAAGLRWELIDMRTEAVPLFVRQAIAHAVDRDALVEVAARPALPEAGVLDSLVYLGGDDDYEPHFAVYPHDPDRAVALLEEHGCRREDDGVFACDGERLSYTMAAVADRDRAEVQVEIIQAQLGAVGIRLEAAFGDIPTVLEQLGQGRADLANLSINLGWEPFWRGALLGCDASVGPSRYCNEEASELLRRGMATLDRGEQARRYNDAGVVLAADVPVLPLYQVPDVLVWHPRVGGVEHSLSGDPFAGVERWHLGD